MRRKHLLVVHPVQGPALRRALELLEGGDAHVQVLLAGER